MSTPAGSGDSEHRLTSSPSVVSRTVGDELVLVDLDGEQYFSLNRTGAVIWEELSQGRSASDAASRIIVEFQVDAETAQADATELQLALVEAGLLINEG